MNNKSVHLRSLILLVLIFTLATIQSHAIVVFINHGVFKNTDKSSFTELYLKVPISSIDLKINEQNKYTASVNVKLEYSYDDSIYASGEFNIVSPEFADTADLNFALTDLLRVVLPYGTYNFQVWITDNHNEKNNTYYASIVSTRFKNSFISFSDILFSDTVYSSHTKNSFTRNTYNVIPNVFNSYSSRQEKLYFYLEFYNADKFIKEENLFVKYYLRMDSMNLVDFQHTKRLKVYSTNYLLGSLLIRDLPIGNYELVAEVFNSKNVKLASKSAYFSKQEKSNVIVEDPEVDSKKLLAQIIKGYSREQLIEYLDYLYVISNHDEIQEAALIKRKNDKDELSEFLYAFWINRNKENPAKAWYLYLVKIEECNKIFGTQLRKGYLTDRGRVYMEYGPPNSVVESENAILSYPYQIWHYYRLNDFQQNKKFIFFNRTGTMDEYELIHSDASGEVKNNDWKNTISRYNNINPTDDDVFGDFLDDDFGQ
ncbi:MAG: GWxTD domain-containing protein [Bacteroidetes bacterium]|nr:GWxTD domain-containing protein [Bacteroidota bacterium]